MLESGPECVKAPASCGIGGNIAYEVANYFLAMRDVAGVRLLVTQPVRLTMLLFTMLLYGWSRHGRGLRLGEHPPTRWRQLVLNLVFLGESPRAR
jgi:hypothetical protein